METITEIEVGNVSRQIEDAIAREDIKTLKNAAGTPTAPKTLTAGETEVTFTAGNIKENSTIRVEIKDISTISHNGIVVDGDNITVKFDPQDRDIVVRVVVFDELEETGTTE